MSLLAALQLCDAVFSRPEIEKENSSIDTSISKCVAVHDRRSILVLQFIVCYPRKTWYMDGAKWIWFTGRSRNVAGALGRVEFDGEGEGGAKRSSNTLPLEVGREIFPRISSYLCWLKNPTLWTLAALCYLKTSHYTCITIIFAHSK